MKDMKAHLQRRRDQAAEAALLSAEVKEKEEREFFAKFSRDLTAIADQAEGVIKRSAPDTFLGRKTHEPFPKEEEG